jgi:hypothetical protein
VVDAARSGATPSISNRKALTTALLVLSIEARHASWIRDNIGKGGNPLPAPLPFDAAEPKARVLVVVKITGFIVGQPEVEAAQAAVRLLGCGCRGNGARRRRRPLWRVRSRAPAPFRAQVAHAALARQAGGSLVVAVALCDHARRC